MSSPEANRPAYADQNVVVAYVGNDDSYFVGRQSQEQARDTVSHFEKDVRAVILESSDWGDDSFMAQTMLEDLRGTYQEYSLHPDGLTKGLIELNG